MSRLFGANTRREHITSGRIWKVNWVEPMMDTGTAFQPHNLLFFSCETHLKTTLDANNSQTSPKTCTLKIHCFTRDFA